MARPPKPRRAGEFRGLGLLALVFIVIPGALILSVGILVLVFGQKVHDVVFGVLILSFAAVLVAGVVATLFYVKREAGVARLQTEFVAKVSHDLRTPLTSIRMFVETLQMGRLRDPETTRQCLDVIAHETERLTALIDRLLDWARMEAGRRSYATAPERVEDVVDAALEAFEPQLMAQPARISREVPASLPRVDVDLAAMSEAVLNLLQNAHRYTGDDKEIRVCCQQRGQTVEIQVEDNGPGIAVPEQHRIFEKFYRAAEALQRNIPGTGLGLAMVESIVHAHHGTVSLRSHPGKGATFVITLPVAEG
jgi:two-component system, OmpR family, phosphate regulon sensor histidine kinase PhoR